VDPGVGDPTTVVLIMVVEALGAAVEAAVHLAVVAEAHNHLTSMR
jgi:diacylglycerol kinase